MSDENRINFRYVQSNEYRVAAVTGAWGGPTPNGEVFASLFCELPQPLETEAYRLTPDGEIEADPLTRTRRDEDGAWVERRVEIGLLIAPRQARRIAEWLISQADKVEKLQEAAHDGE